MKIKILGNGGAISDGLPYNSFLIDQKYLIEAPPDIMNSLYREKADISLIRLIFISHFHGDHYFGLPLLMLRFFFNSPGNKTPGEIKIAGPRDIRNKTLEICRLAVGENHPLHEWIEAGISFIELNSEDSIIIGNDIKMSFFPMDHYIETWGFSFYHKRAVIFSYFADTVWNDSLLEQIRLIPKIIIADMNGEPSDPVKVHLSEDDIITKVLPESKDKIIFYGTHLKYQKKSVNKYIRFAYPGEEIELLC